MDLMACGESAAGSSGPGKIKQGAKPPPPPTKRQLKAFAAMQGEAKIYEKRAKDYKKTLTLIVRHHYEERRRRILSSLDREIKVESKNLDEARNAAITRLEEFIAKYSGDNAHPVSTPDAMFRLAALYEERGRADFDADLTKALVPAINLYRRIIKEYPNYEEIAAVYYYLGHAYTDSSRLDEAQQAWRALVCSNNFKVRADPDDADKIALEPMDQDHDDKFWNDWYNKNPIPLDQVKGPKKRTADQLARADKDEELAFRDPYPDSCKPLPQNTPPGEDPRYIAEVWWQIGNFHFDQLDTKGGPFNLNRALRECLRALDEDHQATTFTVWRCTSALGRTSSSSATRRQSNGS